MAVVKSGGKPAITHVKVLERYLAHSYIECSLETGCTHQIRVHMREANHPLAADPVYGNLRHPCSDAVKEAVKALGAPSPLHATAWALSIRKPAKLFPLKRLCLTICTHLLSVLRLEAGLDSSLSNEEEWQEKFGTDDDDDWNGKTTTMSKSFMRKGLNPFFRRPKILFPGRLKSIRSNISAIQRL